MQGANTRVYITNVEKDHGNRLSNVQSDSPKTNSASGSSTPLSPRIRYAICLICKDEERQELPQLQQELEVLLV